MQQVMLREKNDVLCRDLKVANMLVSDDGRILLADFGACATLEREARLPSLESAMAKSSSTLDESPTGACPSFCD